jgi:hypothetical protein
MLLYKVEQFSDLKRKSIKPIALKVEGENIRAMQRLIACLNTDAA